MKACLVEIYSQTATFRNPEFQNFHKTFMLPPPTTLVGFAGAALGLSPKSAQEFFESSIFKMGVYGLSRGICNDLWKYNNFTTQKSIIKREILFLNNYIIAYASEDENKIMNLINGFKNPIYALTLGGSDSLSFVRNVTDLVIKNIEISKKVEYCLLEGDIWKEVLRNSSNNLEFSIYLTSDPIVYDLPTKFNYESEYGMRSVSTRKTFSFISKEMILNIDKEGISYENKFIPLFNY